MSEPMLSDEQLAEWERRVEAATDGEWYVQRRGGSPLEVRAAWPDEDLRLATIEYLSDADFIVHAHIAVPLLVQALRDARAENERLREVLNSSEAWFGAWECGCTDTERSVGGIPEFCPEHGTRPVSDDHGRTKVRLNHAGVSGYGFHPATLAAPTGQEQQG